jgi:hypothetical protein
MFSTSFQEVEMASEFERFKQDVRGRSVTITSWYDDQRKTWSGSAPAYAHLFSALPTAGGFSSRKAAITYVQEVLENHFDGLPSARH